MSSAYLSSTPTISDHDLTLTLVGDVDTLRPRLVEAVRKLGYRVLDEQPIRAKRAATGGARWECSFEVLDYPTTLLISLKQINELAVVATFSYEVKSYMSMTKGDRKTLAREAEAIAALVSERLSLTACPGCGTPIKDDSHFCRRCGAPLVVDVAELEVHRLTRKSRTAYHNLVIATGSLLIAIVAFLVMALVGTPKVFKVFLLLGSMIAAFGLVALLQSVWQLHFALNPKQVKESLKPQPALTSSITTALPPATVQPSVTEGTTELFYPNSKVAEPVPRKSPDTADIDDERLM